MAHTLRYYKEITHADGKVIRIEFHEKNGTAPAMELGSVIQALNLEIQGGDDIDTPIIKTQLNFTLVDAPDHAEAKTKKCGAWEEFYSPDATHWKVLVFADAQPIWGGYITPDSYHEVLTYRAGISFIARDNIGHLNGFPFDATGNAEGMISMYDLVQTAWRKIDSPMQITTNTATWLKCEDVSGVHTYMNVSAFKGKNWYEVLESVLYAYGLVMRYVGENKVAVYPLREMPFYGKDSVVVSNVLFERGAERELSPATKRIEESVDYTIEETIARPLVSAIEYSGAVVDVTIEGKNVFGETITKTAKANSLTRTFGTGWYNPTQNGTLLLNPKAYNTERVNDYIASDMVFLLNTKNTEVVYSATIVPQNLIIRLAFGNVLEIWGGWLLPKWFDTLSKLRYAISATQNGITQYWDGGTWVAAKKELSATIEGNEVAIKCNARAYSGEVTLELHIYSIRYESTISTEDAAYAALNSLTFVSAESSALLTTNRVNTNYIDTNNVILSREPQLAPAMNTPFVPAVIKNGIFRKDGATYVAASLWSWNGNGKQQMAVYNHLQLLCYYGKPNNVLSGTIVNGDVANFTKLYKWNNTEHIIISGVLNLISGYIENATLREFVRYEDMWGDLTDTADFPEVEGSSKTTADSGTSSQTTTYSNTTNVTIGGGSGTIVLDTFMSDSSTNGVQNRIIKAYVDSSIANLINGAPTTLDTLKEIADAFAESQDVVEALNLAIGDKANKNDVFTKEQTYNREHIDGEVDSINDSIDNLDKNKADKATVNAIDDRLKAEEDVTKTYAAWWAALMQYVKVENGNVVIDTNLLVEGESATRGVGDPSTGGGIDENKLAEYLEEHKYINEDALLEYGFATEQDVNDAIDALNIGDYAKTSEVERLFTALNISQYAKTADVNSALGNKVDKVSGKGLSTNDFTTALLNKLNAIAEGAEVNVQSDWNATSGDAFIKNKPTFADVATSGSYNDLSDKPTIPTTMAWTAITDKPTFALVATTGKYSDLLGAPALAKVAISGKYSDLSGTPDLSVYALTDDVERLFTALNISQYAKTSDLGDLAFEDSLSTSDVSEGTNKYFTNARAVAAVLGSSAIGSTSAYPYWNGSAWQTKTLGNLAFVNSLSKSDVGLGNVANETYAGGTAVTLNGFSKAKTTASFYAPTSAGTVGYFLKSQGAGDAPIWAALGKLATKDSLTYSDVGVTKDVITSLLGTTTYAPYNANGYLPLSGGTLTGTLTLSKEGSDIFVINRLNASSPTTITYRKDNSLLGRMGFDASTKEPVAQVSGTYQTLIHSGNIGSYAMKKEAYNYYALIDTPLNSDNAEMYAYFQRISADGSAISSNDVGSARKGVIRLSGGGSESQLLFDHYNGIIRYRNYQLSSFSAWKTIAFTDSEVDITFANEKGVAGTTKEGEKYRMLYLSNANNLLLGYHTSLAGLDTKINGNNIYLNYGVNHATGLILNSSGNVTIGASDLASTTTKLYVDGKAYINGSLVTQTSILGKGTYGGATLYYGIRENEALSIERINDKTQWVGDGLKLMNNGNLLVGYGSDNNNGKLQVNGGAYISSSLNVNTVAEFTTYDIKIASNMFFNKGQEGIYITGTGISWHNANHAWTAGLVGFAADKITLGQPVSMSSTLSVGGQTTINNNLIVTGDVAVA